MRNRNNCEDAPEYPGRYRVAGFSGVACYVAGWETEPDEDTEWTGQENRTGRLLVVMVGDDTRHAVDPCDLAQLKRSEYCSECGQIGCAHGAGDDEDE